MKLVRTSITIPEDVLFTARIEATENRKSFSKHVVDKLTNGSPVKKTPIDLDKVLGVFDSGDPNYRVPSRHIMYGRYGK